LKNEAGIKVKIALPGLPFGEKEGVGFWSSVVEKRFNFPFLVFLAFTLCEPELRFFILLFFNIFTVK